MDFKDDLPSAIAETKKCIEPMKDIELIMASDSMACLIGNYFPLFALKSLFGDFHAKLSISCSNMAGPRAQKWKFDGNDTHWVTMTTNHMIPEVTFTSMHDTCKVTLSGDSAKNKNYKQLLRLIEEALMTDDY